MNSSISINRFSIEALFATLPAQSGGTAPALLKLILQPADNVPPLPTSADQLFFLLYVWIPNNVTVRLQYGGSQLQTHYFSCLPRRSKRFTTTIVAFFFVFIVLFKRLRPAALNSASYRAEHSSMAWRDDWPAGPDGKEYDGKHLMDTVRNNSSPFRASWDVQLLIRVVEVNLRVQMTDIRSSIRILTTT